MRKIVIVIFLLAAGLLFGIYLYNPDSSVIDPGYITSKKYQSLKKELEKNRGSSRDENSILSEVARKSMHAAGIKDTEYPFQIDSVFVATLVSSKNKITLRNAGLTQYEFDDNNYYPVPITHSKEDLKLVFFLMQRPGMYKDIDVILATMKDSSVVDIESIGSFRKNLSEITTSIIRIHSDRIKTKVEKLRFYPVEQKNIVHYSYSVANDGTILIN